jgi:hypothetical protein
MVLANLGPAEQRRLDDGTVGTRRRLRCTTCGLFRDEFPSSSVFGAPIDPYFRLPLWLRADCCAHVLWAYNRQHLDLLEAYVAAGLRERGTGPGAPMSMVERLPAWLKSAKHRPEVLRTIQRMRISLRRSCVLSLRPHRQKG